MPTDLTPTALLTLLQWLSPGFPIGAFSYSHGLETEVQRGAIRDADGFADWLADVLDHGAGRNDVILLTAAWRGGDLAEIDALARALAPSAERLLETEAQGEAFVATVNTVWGSALPVLTLPVAVGAAARAQDLPLAPVAQGYLHAFAAALTSAATRAVPLGQTAAQTVLAAMAPLCLTIVKDARDDGLDDIGSAAFAAEIAAMRHETLETRIFRS